MVETRPQAPAQVKVYLRRRTIESGLFQKSSLSECFTSFQQENGMGICKFVRHNLPLGKPCWLSPITSLFSMCLHLSIVSRRICSMILLGTEVRLTSLQFLRSYCSPFIKMGVMFPLFQSLGISPACHNVVVQPQSATRHHAAARSLPPPLWDGGRESEEQKNLWVEIRSDYQLKQNHNCDN